jgi:hypothetical protein
MLIIKLVTVIVVQDAAWPQRSQRLATRQLLLHLKAKTFKTNMAE